MNFNQGYIDCNYLQLYTTVHIHFAMKKELFIHWDFLKYNKQVRHRQVMCKAMQSILACVVYGCLMSVKTIINKDAIAQHEKHDHFFPKGLEL